MAPTYKITATAISDGRVYFCEETYDNKWEAEQAMKEYKEYSTNADFWQYTITEENDK